MNDSRTHYQVSFTARQALSLFVGLLAILGLSYFFGLMTGLSGNEAATETSSAPETVAGSAAPPGASPEPTPAAGVEERDSLTFPAPVTAAPIAGASRSGTPATIHAFEDGADAPPPAVPRTSLPARAATPRPAVAAAGSPGGFRVQVLSVSSRADADAEAGRLSRLGLPVRVEPGTGPRGTVYRVRVGPFATREEAEQASRRLSSQGRRDAWIVPPGQ